MTHGGARAGAGRKRSPRETKTVSWRLSSYAREWITKQAAEQGVSSGEIIDELIKSFEEHAEQDTYEAIYLASLED